MKKTFFAAVAVCGFFVPALLFAAPNKLMDNPYSVNDPMRNFFNNLTDKQKTLVIFWKDMAGAKKPATIADSGFKTDFFKGDNHAFISAAINAAQSQIDAFVKTKDIKAISSDISSDEGRDLEQTKFEIMSGFIAKARIYLQIAAEKRVSIEFVEKLDQANKTIGKSMEIIEDNLLDNQLGFDKSGYFIKYDSKGVKIELEVNDTYMKQEGDVYRDVPFFSQAPGGGWSDTCQAAACEEVALAQANLWINNVDYKDPYGIYSDDDMLQRYGIRQILAMCDFQYKNNSSHLYHDSGMADTGLLWQNFYQSRSNLIINPNLADLKSGLSMGHIYLVPIVGPKILTTPIPYKDPALIPAHSVLLVGYSDKRNEFIINDPGTIRGKGWRFNQTDFMAAIRDYPSGDKEKTITAEKRVIEFPARIN